MSQFNTIKAIIGVQDPTLLDVFKYVDKVAPANQRIIIYGTIGDNWNTQSHLLRMQKIELIEYLIKLK